MPTNTRTHQRTHDQMAACTDLQARLKITRCTTLPPKVPPRLEIARFPTCSRRIRARRAWRACRLKLAKPSRTSRVNIQIFPRIGYLPEPVIHLYRQFCLSALAPSPLPTSSTKQRHKIAELRPPPLHRTYLHLRSKPRSILIRQKLGSRSCCRPAPLRLS